ncbi:MAG: hypothetical protein V1930_05195 [Pseudomonadota bacterium]
MKRIPYIYSLSSLLLVLLLDTAFCLAGPTSPVEIVTFFDKHYGGPLMDEIAQYTTPKFRDNRPKSVWVMETWKELQKIKYERLGSKVLESEVVEDRFMVVIQVKIKAGPSERTQKEIYYLIKEEERWLIDERIVTDEKILKKIVGPGQFYDGKSGKVIPATPEMMRAIEKETDVRTEKEEKR